MTLQPDVLANLLSGFLGAVIGVIGAFVIAIYAQERSSARRRHRARNTDPAWSQLGLRPSQLEGRLVQLEHPINGAHRPLNPVRPPSTLPADRRLSERDQIVRADLNSLGSICAPCLAAGHQSQCHQRGDAVIGAHAIPRAKGR